MKEPIKGYTDGIDYEIACLMAERFAKKQGWSSTKKYKPGRLFDYEFIMSRLGSKDSNNPSVKIAVGYNGGNKAVELWRYGKWSALICLGKNGEIISGQFQYDQGIDDLTILRSLYYEVKSEVFRNNND